MIDRELFRRTMRQWAAGVTVITVQAEGRVHGMTANSFTSVSCSPPLVLFCIDKDNDTHQMVQVGRTVGISLLSDVQTALSSRFATKTSARYQLEDLDRIVGPNGATLFQNCSAIMEAKISQAHDAGDHTIFVGQILWADCNHEKRPLVYSQGAYARLAPLSTESPVSGNRAALQQDARLR